MNTLLLFIHNKQSRQIHNSFLGTLYDNPIHHIPLNLNTALIIIGPPPMRLGASSIPKHGPGAGGTVPVTIVAGSALGLAADGVACNTLRMGWWRKGERGHVVPWVAKL